MVELLSPAGNLEKLETAFNFGADAAYMGLTDFSLRKNAGNFSLKDIEKVKALKAEKNKRLYCTMNIVFSEDQIDALNNMKDQIALWPFDAFIVSDLGTISFFQKNFPDKELHLSTQASCINSEAAKLYHALGFKRVILGREASIDDIKRIKDKVPELELEAFVHGAMCMSYSGRCMLSAHLNGRSANQGDCSHTCRWNYKLHYALEEEERKGTYFPIEETDGYTTILSSKDLCMFDHVDKLKAAGLSSLKIEGRMKSIYYVAIVTRAYRKALDNDPELEKYRRDLFDVSHREYTTGFFFRRSGNIEDKSEDVSFPTEYGYERNYTFLGSVKDCPNADEGIYELNVKNQILKGDTLEFIGNDEPVLKVTDYKLLDKDFSEISQLDHGKISYIKTDAKLKIGYIMRKETKESERKI